MDTGIFLVTIIAHNVEFIIERIKTRIFESSTRKMCDGIESEIVVAITNNINCFHVKFLESVSHFLSCAKVTLFLAAANSVSGVN
jgi:hypothetical protein